METFVLLLMVAALGAWQLKSENQARGVALLGSFLGHYQLEKRMESLTEGYLRALGEKDTERQAQIWNMLAAAEEELVEQFGRFAADFSAVVIADARVSKLPVFLPEADRFFSKNTFDMRKALAVHAAGIARVAKNTQGRTARDKAYTLSAELFLMQHRLNWKAMQSVLARCLMRLTALSRSRWPMQVCPRSCRSNRPPALMRRALAAINSGATAAVSSGQ